MTFFKAITTGGITFLAGVFASSAQADSIKLDVSVYSNGSNGGSYTLTPLSGPLTNSSYSSLAILSATSFETFCLEPGEYFSAGGTYAYTINSAAIVGGLEAAIRNIGLGDQLSLGTAFLYSQFATGTLAVFDYSASGRKTSNLALQRAIWWLEDETQGSLTSAYQTLLTTQFGGTENARGNALPGGYDVFAVNLTSNSGTTNNQSQLYYHIPDSGATFSLLGVALAGMAAFRMMIRRRA